MSSHTPEPGTRLAAIDGRDALAFVIVRPAAGDDDHVSVEAAAHGMSKPAAAFVLRQVAAQFDEEAAAAGEQPITAEEIAEHERQLAAGAGSDDDDRPWMRP